MEITVHEEKGVTVLSVSGELDGVSSPQLSQLCDKLFDEGRRTFVIDLKDVAFIDSSGLSTLVRFFKHVKGGTGNLRLAGLQPPVRRIFELTRLDRAFAIHTDVSEAMRRLIGG